MPTPGENVLVDREQLGNLIVIAEALRSTLRQVTGEHAADALEMAATVNDAVAQLEASVGTDVVGVRRAEGHELLYTALCGVLGLDPADVAEGEWRVLPLEEKDIEVAVHLAVKPEASPSGRLRDLWPHLSHAEARHELDEAVGRINRAATVLTGKPGPVIGTEGDRRTGPVPTLRISVLGPPTVMVR